MWRIEGIALAVCGFRLEAFARSDGGLNQIKKLSAMSHIVSNHPQTDALYFQEPLPAIPQISKRIFPVKTGALNDYDPNTANTLQRGYVKSVNLRSTGRYRSCGEYEC